jgi:uncharacterized protein YukE
MASLSDLNKREREIRGNISRLRRQFREKEISKKDFDKAFGASNSELEKITREKSNLIGKALPPLPPPPRPPERSHKPSMLDAIKKSILQDKDIEPPGPPVLIREKPPEPGPVKTIVKEKIKEVPVIKEKIKKVPVVKEKIKRVEIPIIKERIKEVKVPVVKEKIKEVPVIKERIKRVEVPVVKEVKVPTGDPEMAKKLEGGLKEIDNVKLDVARQGQECSQMAREINDIKQRLKNLDNMKSELKSLGTRTENIDFQGLTQEIYSQFEKMNKDIRDSERRTDDLVERFNVEIKTLKEKMGETKQAKEHVEGLDISNIRRDMESLKQKSQYIEQHLERVDVKPIVEMIKEVENKVNNLRASSALIIE